jgi:hypothetical protein
MIKIVNVLSQYIQAEFDDRYLFITAHPIATAVSARSSMILLCPKVYVSLSGHLYNTEASNYNNMLRSNLVCVELQTVFHELGCLRIREIISIDR